MTEEEHEKYLARMQRAESRINPVLRRQQNEFASARNQALGIAALSQGAKSRPDVETDAQKLAKAEKRIEELTSRLDRMNQKLSGLRTPQLLLVKNNGDGTTNDRWINEDDTVFDGENFVVDDADDKTHLLDLSTIGDGLTAVAWLIPTLKANGRLVYKTVLVGGAGGSGNECDLVYTSGSAGTTTTECARRYDLYAPGTSNLIAEDLAMTGHGQRHPIGSHTAGTKGRYRIVSGEIQLVWADEQPQMDLCSSSTSSILTSAASVTAGELVRYNTSGGGFTVQLPASPNDGDQIVFQNANASVNALTVDRNGNNINGAAADGSLTTAWGRKTFTFVTSVGWTMA